MITIADNLIVTIFGYTIFAIALFCLPLREQELPLTFDFRLLAQFGLFHALGDIILFWQFEHGVELAHKNAWVSICLFVCSIPLLEYGRRRVVHPSGSFSDKGFGLIRQRMTLILVALVVLTIVVNTLADGDTAGCFAFAVRFFMGVPAFLLAAYAFWHNKNLTRGYWRTGQRICMVVISGALVLIGVANSVMPVTEAPLTGRAPVSVFLSQALPTQEQFYLLFGFPARIGGAVGVILMAAFMFMLIRLLNLDAAQNESRQADDIAQLQEIENINSLLLNREERLTVVIDNILDGIITIDSDGMIESFNKSAERIFGYVAEEVIGQNVSILMPEPYRQEHDGYLLHFKTTGIKKVIGTGRQVVGRRKDGSEFPMDLAIAQMRLDNQAKFTGIVRDITKRLEQESKLHDASVMLNTVLEGSASYVHVRDLNGCYLYVNTEYERIFNCKKEDILGQHLSAVLNTDLAAEIDRHEQALRQNRQAFHTETTVQCPDGVHTYLVSRSPLLNKQGELFATMGVGMDITRMKELEQDAAQTLSSLKDSEERWMFALEGAGEGVWDWDMVHDKVQYSKRWKEMLGYAESDIADTVEEWSTRVHPDDMPAVMADVTANMQGKTISFSNEHRFLQKDGTYKWIHDRGMVVRRDEEGVPLRMVGTHSDISERKKMERLKSEFISTVSHELRTPLTSIRGSLGLLEAGALGDLSPQALELIKIAHKNSQRLILLVNDLLDMEKLISGKMTYQLETVNLVDLIRLSIESNAAYAANYLVRYQLINQEPISVMADSNRLQQVMANMMSNAAKFSPPNSVVEIGYSCEAQVARITVEDHGMGIPEEFQDRIFEAFSQAYNSNTRKQGGTGLGLNISKKIMKEMGGDMGYATLAGKGTTFWVTLPVPQAGREPVCQG